MMKNYYDQVKIPQNPNCHYIFHHIHKILNIGGWKPGEANALLNLKKHQQANIVKCIYTSKKHLNKGINYLSLEEKK